MSASELPLTFPSINLPNHLTLCQPLGEGGMSHVWLAEDERLKRLVAIKVLQSGHQSVQALDEAQLLAKINHPNVVQIYEAIPTEQGMALVMEYIEGINLSRSLDLHTIAWQKAVYWLEQIAWGLHAAHQEGVIHGDIKASNIMLLREDQPKLIDFGIGRQLTTDTDESFNKGYTTLSHCAPELTPYSAPTVAADLFALGCVAYEMLSGCKFSAAIRQSEEQITTLNRVRPELPDVLIALVDQLLANDPAMRPMNAAEVADCLRLLLKNEYQERGEKTQPAIAQKKYSNPDVNKSKLKPLLLVAFIISGLVGIATTYRVMTPSKPTYVAVLPPEWSGDGDATLLDKESILAAIYSAQRQMIVNAESLHAIPESDIRFTQKQLKLAESSELGQALSADALIQTKVSCSESLCEIDVELLQGKGEIKWYASRAYKTNAIASSYGELFDSASIQLSALFPRQTFNDSVSSLVMADKDYTRYVSLQKSILLQKKVNEDYVEELQRLQETYPNFHPVYKLYTTLLLRLYERSKNSVWVGRLKQHLKSASVSYKNTNDYWTDSFYLALREKRWSDSQSILKKIEGRPIDPLLLMRLKSKLYEAVGDSSEALRLERKIHSMNPSFRNAYYLARSLVIAGLLKESINILEAFSVKYNDNVSITSLLAFSLLHSGKLNKSINLYKKLVTITGKSKDKNHLALGLMLAQKYSLAHGLFEDLCSLNTQNSMYCLNYADNLWLLGDKKQSLIEYQKIIETHSLSNDGYTLLDVAQAYAHLDKPALAVKALYAAKDAKVSAKDFYFTSALVNTIVGDYTSAAVSVQSALELGYGVVWFSLPWFNSLCNATMPNSRLSEKINSLLCGP